MRVIVHKTMFEYEFFRNAVLAAVIISIAAGIIGTYIVTRRMVAVSGGITHACFGGLGLGYFLGISPLFMAALTACGAAAGVEWMSTRGRLREDSAVAVVWSVGMAVGVLAVFLTPGYVPELNSFLFGNLLTVSRMDLAIFAIYTVMLTAFFIWKGRAIVLTAFDRDFAQVMGLPVRAVSYAMTLFVAVGIVLTIRLVGVMLLMAVLTLPQLTAETLSRRFMPIVIWSVILSVLCSLGGLGLGMVIDVPCSALIVIVMSAVYALARLLPRRRRPAGTKKQ